MGEWDKLLKLKTKPKEEKIEKFEKEFELETQAPALKESLHEPRGKVRSIQTLKKKKRFKLQLNDMLKTLDLPDLTTHQKRALGVFHTSKPDWKDRKKDTQYYQKEVTVAGLELILSLLMGEKVRINF